MTKEHTCSYLPMLCVHMEQDNSVKQLEELHGSNCNLFLRFEHWLLHSFLCCLLAGNCVFVPPNLDLWLFITIIPGYLKINDIFLQYHIRYLCVWKPCPCHIHRVSLLSPGHFWASWVRSDLSMVVLGTSFGLDYGKWILWSHLSAFPWQF